MKRSVTSRSATNSHPAFELLEQRTLLSADWAGTWTINGYLNEADTNNTAATFKTSNLAVNVTIENLGGGNYRLNVPKYSKQFDLQLVGDELQGHSAGLDNTNQYRDEYVRVLPINDNAAIFLEADGGYSNASQADLQWSTGAMGLVTRGAVTTTARPWVGEYSVNEYSVHASDGNGSNAGQVTIEPDTGTIIMTDLGGGKYAAEKVGEGQSQFVTSGKGLISTKSQTCPDGLIEEERIWVFRGPDDTGYFLNSGVEFYAGHQGINSAWHGVGILTPKAGSEYKPDLSISIPGVAGDFLPGETVTVPVRISNLGTAPAAGKINLELWTPIDSANPTTSKLQAIKLAPGASMNTTMTFVVPADTTPADWNIQVDADTTDAIAETNENNNSAQADAFCSVVWDFGTVGGKPSRKLNLTDSDGTIVTFGLTGPGTGTVSDFTGQWEVTLSGNTSSSTSVSITTKKGTGDGKTELASLTAPAAIKSIAAPTTDLVGPMNLTGASAAGVTITLAQVVDGSIDSAMPIQSLTVEQWSDTVDVDPFAADLAAPSMVKITVVGDFQGDVVLTGGLGTAAIGGSLAGSLWDVGGTIAKMTVTGDVGQSIVRSGLDILNLTIGSSTQSDFGAGVSTDLLKTDRHVDVSDVASLPTGTIKTFTIKGRKTSPADRFFADSSISAGIGSLSLVNWDGLEGLFAPKGKIKSIKYKDLANPSNNWVFPPKGTVNAGPDQFVHVNP